MKIKIRTLRPALLIATAAGIGAYVSLSTPTTQSADSAVEPRSRATQRLTRNQSLEHSEHRASANDRAVVVSQFVNALFKSRSWYQAPPPPPAVAAVVLPPPAPTAPPLPFTALGSYVKAGGEPVFFLARGDRVYDVKLGEILDGIYSVDTFANGQLQFTYLPLKIQQTLSVAEAQ
jgi:hypothetical protein